MLLPLTADLGVKGTAAAALELIVDEAAVALLARPIGVKDGESTLRLFFDLSQRTSATALQAHSVISRQPLHSAEALCIDKQNQFRTSRQSFRASCSAHD